MPQRARLAAIRFLPHAPTRRRAHAYWPKPMRPLATDPRATALSKTVAPSSRGASLVFPEEARLRSHMAFRHVEADRYSAHAGAARIVAEVRCARGGAANARKIR